MHEHGPRRSHQRQDPRVDQRLLPCPPLSQDQRTFQSLAIELALLIAATPKPPKPVPGTSVLSGMSW